MNGKGSLNHLFDDIARILASPTIPRRRAFKLIAGAVGSAGLPFIWLGRGVAATGGTCVDFVKGGTCGGRCHSDGGNQGCVGVPPGTTCLDAQGRYGFCTESCGNGKRLCCACQCASPNTRCGGQKCCSSGMQCCTDGTGGQGHCCHADETCCGRRCCASGQTCCGDKRCYPSAYTCCPAGQGCPSGDTCCGRECCDPGQVCCDGRCYSKKASSSRPGCSG
jgi:hypothetical protein